MARAYDPGASLAQPKYEIFDLPAHLLRPVVYSSKHERRFLKKCAIASYFIPLNYSRILVISSLVSVYCSYHCPYSQCYFFSNLERVFIHSSSDCDSEVISFVDCRGLS